MFLFRKKRFNSQIKKGIIFLRIQSSMANNFSKCINVVKMSVESNWVEYQLSLGCEGAGLIIGGPHKEVAI